jgi:hypothetical protein
VGRAVSSGLDGWLDQEPDESEEPDVDPVTYFERGKSEEEIAVGRELDTLMAASMNISFEEYRRRLLAVQPPRRGRRP